MEDKNNYKLIEKILNSKIRDIKDLSIGYDQNVYLIKTEKEKYIYKEPKNNIAKIKNEAFALKKLSSIGVPIPKLIYINDKFLIESFIEGELLNNNCPKNCFIELGNYINKIHSIQMNGFGDIKDGRGEYDSEYDYLFSWLNLNDLSNKMFKNYDLKKIFEKNKNLLQSNNSYFLHGDITYDNSIVYNNKINGIIDFGDAICGPIEYDLALFYLKIENDNNWEDFLKGYNKIFNEKKFHLYIIAFGIWLIQEGLINEKGFGYQKFLNSINVFLCEN